MCPAGSYCPPGSLEAHPCPAKRTSNPAASAVSSCTVRAHSACTPTQMRLLINPAPILLRSSLLQQKHPTTRSFPVTPSTSTQHRAHAASHFCGLLQGVAGFYGPPGEDVAPCPAGSYCPAGAMIPTACPANTQSAASASAAVDCTPFPGYFGRPGEAATLCPGGSYCPPGVESATQCPANTHSPAGATDPLACQVFLHSLDSGNDLESPHPSHAPVSSPSDPPFALALFPPFTPLLPCHHPNSNPSCPIPTHPPSFHLRY
jgi:hypothetical protein